MAVQVAEAEFKRRARRRLMGAVALTILAVIVLPLVLDKEPPPAGPLNIQMPLASGTPAPAEPAPAAATAPAAKPADVVGNADASSAAATGKKASSLRESAVGEYSVQVGAFTDATNVNRIKARIQSLGLPAFTDRLDGKTRVRAGPFPDKSTAESAAGKLEAVGLPAKLEGP